MLTSDKAYPETAMELLAECEEQVSRTDLYTLGEPSDLIDSRDGCPPAGDYLFGVACIPAQWVVRALADHRGEVCPGCKRLSQRSWDFCPYCGQGLANGREREV